MLKRKGILLSILLMSIGLCLSCTTRRAPESGVNSSTPQGEQGRTKSYECALAPDRAPVSIAASCKQETDCASFEHRLDCCGTVLAVGLSKTSKSLAVREEQSCSSRAVCECLAGPIQTEDGRTASSWEAVGLRCEAGLCNTYSREPSLGEAPAL
jgi:hypothetical protein